jgi:creatinine amidohydrolase
MKSPKTKKVLWQQMRRPELEDAMREKAVVIVPVGSTEQHGPHLPVDTDIHQAFEIAVRAAQAVEGFRVVVAPPIWSGFSPHHMGFVGAISLRMQTFANLITDVCASIYAHGFRKIVLLNGHGGNMGVLTSTAMELSRRDISVAVITYWRLIDHALKEVGESPLGGMAHAGEAETSLQLYLRPELVETSFTPAEYRKPIANLGVPDMRSPSKVFFGMDDFRRDTMHGVAGDPNFANAEKGQKFLEAAVEQVVTFLREFHEAKG